jgi:hypothetical protein
VKPVHSTQPAAPGAAASVLASIEELGSPVVALDENRAHE